MGKGSDYSRKYKHFMLFDADGSFNRRISDWRVEVVFSEPPTTEVIAELEKTAVSKADDVDAPAFAFTFEDEAAADKFYEFVQDRDDCTVTRDYPSYEWDDEAYADFTAEVAAAFSARPYPRKYRDNDAYIFADTAHLKVGIDAGGDYSCVFVEAKTYDDGPDEIEYEINNTVQRGFKRLVETYGAGFFRYPTTAWTSAPYTAEDFKTAS